MFDIFTKPEAETEAKIEYSKTEDTKVDLFDLLNPRKVWFLPVWEADNVYMLAKQLSEIVTHMCAVSSPKQLGHLARVYWRYKDKWPKNVDWLPLMLDLNELMHEYNEFGMTDGAASSRLSFLFRSHWRSNGINVET